MFYCNVCGKKDFQSKLMLAGIQYGWATALRKLVNVAHGDIICRDQLSEDNRLTGITEGFCGLLFLATYVLNLHERVALHLSQTNLCQDLRFFSFPFLPSYCVSESRISGCHFTASVLWVPCSVWGSLTVLHKRISRTVFFSQITLPTRTSEWKAQKGSLSLMIRLTFLIIRAVQK